MISLDPILNTALPSGECQKSLTNRIIKLQKRALRYIDNAGYNSHTGPIFSKYKLLTFQDQINYSQACFMYRYCNNLLPPSFNNLFIKLNNFDRSLAFRLPIVKTSLKTLTTYSMLKIWNELPLDIRRIKSFNSFKNKYRQILSDKYNENCNDVKCYSCYQKLISQKFRFVHTPLFTSLQIT